MVQSEAGRAAASSVHHGFDPRGEMSHPRPFDVGWKKKSQREQRFTKTAALCHRRAEKVGSHQCYVATIHFCHCVNLALGAVSHHICPDVL